MNIAPDLLSTTHKVVQRMVAVVDDKRSPTEESVVQGVSSNGVFEPCQMAQKNVLWAKGIAATRLNRSIPDDSSDGVSEFVLLMPPRLRHCVCGGIQVGTEVIFVSEILECVPNNNPTEETTHRTARWPFRIKPPWPLPSNQNSTGALGLH